MINRKGQTEIICALSILKIFQFKKFGNILVLAVVTKAESAVIGSIIVGVIISWAINTFGGRFESCPDERSLIQELMLYTIVKEISLGVQDRSGLKWWIPRLF